MRRFGGVAAAIVLVVAGCGGASSPIDSDRSRRRPRRSPWCRSTRPRPSSHLHRRPRSGRRGDQDHGQLQLPDGRRRRPHLCLGPGADPSSGLNMRFETDKMIITVATGAGKDFRSRTFEGTGFKHFDAAKGVQIDGPPSARRRPRGRTAAPSGPSPRSRDRLTAGTRPLGRQTSPSPATLKRGDERRA